MILHAAQPMRDIDLDLGLVGHLHGALSHLSDVRDVGRVDQLSVGDLEAGELGVTRVPLSPT